MRMVIMLWLCCLSGCLTSCAGKNATFDQRQQALAGSMDVLRQARFKGSVRFNEGGSPFGLNAATNWSLGPQQMTFAVEGDVDFTQAPRPHDPVDTAAHSALMNLTPEERVAFLNSGGVRGVTFSVPRTEP